MDALLLTFLFLTAFKALCHDASRSLEKNLTELFDVLGVAVAPARVGGKQFGSLLQFGIDVAAIWDAVEVAYELLSFLLQNQVDKKLARIRVLCFGAERDGQCRSSRGFLNNRDSNMAGYGWAILSIIFSTACR